MPPRAGALARAGSIGVPVGYARLDLKPPRECHQACIARKTIMLDSTAPSRRAIPFDADRLDLLMEEAGIDVLLATSKHNVQYLLGGHRAFFFDYMDAMGLSRYLPIMIYPKGKPEKAAYFGHRLENFQQQVKPLWTPQVQASSSGALDTMQKATDYLRSLGVPARRIGIETTFMPMDAGAALESALPDAEIKDALVVLERQRLRKSPEELALLRTASEKVIDAMMSVIASHGPGSTKE